MPESVLFWIMGPLAVAAALGMLIVKKAVHSALLLAWVMITLAFFYIAQGALFLGIVQIVVYTGAVMMLFLFILMLVGVDASDSLTETIRGLRPIAITAAIGFGGLMVSLIGRASLGAMVLAHHQREVPRSTQRDLSEQRFRSGSLATAAGLPGPGVFARHNAVDVPALLPDGTAAPASISETLRTRGDMIDSSQFQLDQVNTEVKEEK